ncbi:hypothetical protein GQ54DRAFT_312390 [Martensiomyces pterosporus]|nr:hypothetical protein GQ54DRAFT_312390 [Martensiomyces pterosporus]
MDDDSLEPAIRIMLMVADICTRSSKALEMGLAQRALDELFSRSAAFAKAKLLNSHVAQGVDSSNGGSAGSPPTSVSLRIAYRAVEQAASCTIEGWLALGRQSKAVGAFRALLEVDKGCCRLWSSVVSDTQQECSTASQAPTYDLCLAVIHTLASMSIHKGILLQLTSMLIGKDCRVLGHLPESAVTDLLMALYRRQCYSEVVLWAA